MCPGKRFRFRHRIGIQQRKSERRILTALDACQFFAFRAATSYDRAGPLHAKAIHESRQPMIFRATLCATWIFASGMTATAASLTPVGPLTGDTVAEVFAVSADGTVVAGRSRVPEARTTAFRWTLDAGVEGLPNILSGGLLAGSAYGVSGDGQYIVGRTNDDHSFRWSEASGVEFIGGYHAQAASYDGSVVVGTIDIGTIVSDFHASRWSEADGMMDLGGSSATGVSADGNTVVGNGFAGFYRWTPSGGREVIGPGTAYAISADASTIVGSTSPGVAFHWNAVQGLVAHGGTPFSQAYAVNADGSAIAGRTGVASHDTYAFIESESLGARNIKELLGCQGVDVTGWNLFEATGISADGNTVVGNGIDPSGARVGWVALLDEIELTGDTNRDGTVDLTDLNNVRNHFDDSGSPILGDTNFDCGVDLTDLNAVRNHFGAVTSQAVPEPAGVGLVAVAAVGLLFMRRMKDNQ